jgi:hypothetical protein
VFAVTTIANNNEFLTIDLRLVYCFLNSAGLRVGVSLWFESRGCSEACPARLVEGPASTLVGDWEPAMKPAWRGVMQ